MQKLQHSQQKFNAYVKFERGKIVKCSHHFKVISDFEINDASVSVTSLHSMSSTTVSSLVDHNV